MKIEVAYVVDIQGAGAFQFADQLVVSLKSMCETARPDDETVVHIVYHNLSDGVIGAIAKLTSDSFRIQFDRIPDGELERMQAYSKQRPDSPFRAWCGVVFARLYLARYLPKVDRVLYLDADTLIRGPLNELFSWDLKGKIFGMVPGIVPEYGYNSGVMVMDLKRMRDEDVFPAMDEHIAKYARAYKCHDQTVINRHFANEITPVDFKYNYPPMPGQLGTDRKMLVSAVIWHFYNQQVKPVRMDDQGFALVEWNRILFGDQAFIGKPVQTNDNKNTEKE